MDENSFSQTYWWKFTRCRWFSWGTLRMNTPTTSHLTSSYSMRRAWGRERGLSQRRRRQDCRDRWRSRRTTSSQAFLVLPECSRTSCLIGTVKCVDFAITFWLCLTRRSWILSRSLWIRRPWRKSSTMSGWRCSISPRVSAMGQAARRRRAREVPRKEERRRLKRCQLLWRPIIWVGVTSGRRPARRAREMTITKTMPMMSNRHHPVQAAAVREGSRRSLFKRAAVLC